MFGLVVCFVTFDVRSSTFEVVERKESSPEPRTSNLEPPQSAERHLANIRQLTAGRKNAEAYFSFDGTKLIFQSTND
ncbi:MAG: hypothetical protein AAB049_03275, partial [Nitrospirota bacterium]